MLADQVAVIFFDGAAAHLESHDEKYNADARATEHSTTFHMPGSRDEAAVDGVPVPKHLSRQRVSLQDIKMGRNLMRILTEIWQLPPIDIDIDEVAAGVAEVAVAPMAMVEVISLISIVALQTLDR